MNTSAARVAVVVGLMRRDDGAVLMTSRPCQKVYEGYWEFPGGKVESHETAAQALQRELQEEIGVVVTTHHPAWTVSHDYAHAHVDLHFYWVTSWRGNPQPLERQQIVWVRPGEAWPYPVLPASVPLLDRIGLTARTGPSLRPT